MLCYRDRTWCMDSKTCITECNMRITDEVSDAADRWWNQGEEDKKKWTGAPFSMQPMKDAGWCPGFKEKK